MGERVPAQDAELVEHVRNGIDSAGTDLFERYSRRVYYLALRELRSPADAEDIRAETFLRVISAIRNRQIASPESIASFILGVTRNVILEFLRSPHRVASDRNLPDIAAEEPAPELDEDVRRAIEITINRLKPRERQFLRLHFYEELPKEEIARRIGIDEERIRLLKSRCLKSFREIYQRMTKISDTKKKKRSPQC